MVKKRSKITCNWLFNKIGFQLKKVDIYGKPVTFTYNSHFKNITTPVGGILTIIISSTVFAYLYQQVS